MTWNVFREDANTRKIYVFNVFNHGSYLEDVMSLKKLQKVGLPREEFDRRLDALTRYYYWSKCEHEVIITSWPTCIDCNELKRLTSEGVQHVYAIDPIVSKKVDVYSQLALNWDVFCGYVWGANYE